VYSSEATHNVVMVDACTVPSDAPTLTSGDDRVVMGDAGQWHFICGVEGHCESGMKLAVNVP
jgi:plastocyanin